VNHAVKAIQTIIGEKKMYFDRFDIVIAYYFYYCDYHDGQFSQSYARLCRIADYFKPSPLWGNIYDTENENAIEIYSNLVIKEMSRFPGFHSD
jgi:hypothetical protein